MSSGDAVSGAANQGSRFGSGLVTGLVIGLVIAAAIGVATGLLTGSSDEDPVVKARQVLDDNYFHDPDNAKLDDAAIEGMVEQLKKRYGDKFSNYFTAEQLKEFNAATSGHFSGVGLTVTEVPRGLRVASVLPDTPAEHAGLEEGDMIVAVDGKSIEGVASDVSTTEIKGPPGTEVTLKIVPADGSKAHEVTLQRADVRVPAAHGGIRRTADGRKVGYVRFETFSQGAHGELRNEIEDLYRRGAEGLVLDMRGNGGGLLNEAVLSASIFLEDGNVVSTRSRTQGDRDYPAVGDAIEPRPTVVLVNRDTASAAEILTAALQQNDLAEVVGTRTYGKGTFQEVMNLPAGGALDITIGEYLTANGTSILGKGVKPDVRVNRAQAESGSRAGIERGIAVLAPQLDAGQP
ncbi:MAG: carboxyl-terminal processing protease [Solirubrobacterales bacterium]|nr:carboxyl-terminal processing protease [Solirubrobacterales bacterium]